MQGSFVQDFEKVFQAVQGVLVSRKLVFTYVF